MEINAFNALKDFMSVIWQLFAGWNLPFTQMSPAQLIFLVLVIKFTIKLLNATLTVSPIRAGFLSDEIRSAYDKEVHERVENYDWV